MRTKSNNRKEVTIAQMFIFEWPFISRSSRGCLSSLLFNTMRRETCKHVLPTLNSLVSCKRTTIHLFVHRPWIRNWNLKMLLVRSSDLQLLWLSFYRRFWNVLSGHQRCETSVSRGHMLSSHHRPQGRGGMRLVWLALFHAIFRSSPFFFSDVH